MTNPPESPRDPKYHPDCACQHEHKHPEHGAEHGAEHESATREMAPATVHQPAAHDPAVHEPARVAKEPSGPEYAYASTYRGHDDNDYEERRDKTDSGVPVWGWVLAVGVALALAFLSFQLFRSNSDDAEPTTPPAVTTGAGEVATATTAPTAAATTPAATDAATATATDAATPAPTDAPTDGATGGPEAQPAGPDGSTGTILAYSDVYEYRQGDRGWDVQVNGLQENVPAEEVTSAELPAAGEGNKWIRVDISATHRGPGTLSPWIDVQYVYFLPDGTEIAETPTTLPTALVNQPSLATNENAKGNLYFEVPADSSIGSLKIQPLEAGAEPAFVNLAR